MTKKKNSENVNILSVKPDTLVCKTSYAYPLTMYH